MAVQLYNISIKMIESLPRRFERKYYIMPKEVGIAYGLIRQTCLPTKEYYSEQINSLYFDTADLDQYERSLSGDYQKDKVRIRWYGEDKNLPERTTVFLELKSRLGFASTKQRLRLEVPTESLALDNLRKGIIPHSLLMDTMARFGYFPSQLLQPVIKISYWRYRFREIMTEQRISLDYHIRSTMIMPETGNGEKELGLSGAVLEMKGQTLGLPQNLVSAGMLDTDWTRFSKYSACIDSHTDVPGSVGRLSPTGRVIYGQSIF